MMMCKKHKTAFLNMVIRNACNTSIPTLKSTPLFGAHFSMGLQNFPKRV